ncbi:uncharacterized protein LOC111628385 [Centruroides sculpturatus]|uniref:uncharacterized protein LOC111628385 n=1 Tax=Centruroides sculpturatus TaxID=218467 RepID=UPI000C6D9A7A|nr:uncharacterized protein LOC111628385 [Centruroides sculpturatus]
MEYSNFTFTPYPIQYENSFQASFHLNFLQPVTCDAIFFLTLLPCGKDKNEALKTFTFGVKFVMEVFKKCAKDKNAYYSCLERDYAKKLQNGNNIQPGRIYGCANFPKMFNPGCYDVFLEFRQKEGKNNVVEISCYKLTNVKVEK